MLCCFGFLCFLSVAIPLALILHLFLSYVLFPFLFFFLLCPFSCDFLLCSRDASDTKSFRTGRARALVPFEWSVSENNFYKCRWCFYFYFFFNLKYKIEILFPKSLYIFLKFTFLLQIFGFYIYLTC